MEHYQVSARKYRPATFSSVVGQNALTATLKNAIASGRLAHSYLFCGGRGVGKTSCARIFAKTINCEHPTADGEACNECDSCRAFNNGSSLNIIEMDAASNNGVDAMRELTDQVLVAPANGRYRVFIIDEVHMLSQQAFNAFLKTLEEPPAHAIFILATTEKHKIIPTILSRCQIYDFNPISIRDIVNHLTMVSEKEGIKADPAALAVIARKADGAMRDALSIFDQVAASTRDNITYEATLENLNVLGSEVYGRLMKAFLAGDVMATWLIYKEVRTRGFDSHFFVTGLAAYMRDLMVAREPSTRKLLDADDAAAEAMAAIAKECSPGFLYRAMCLLNDADLNWRTASNKQFLVELTLAKICQSLRPSANDGRAAGQLKPIDRQTAPAAAASAAATPAPQPARQQPQPAATVRPGGYTPPRQTTPGAGGDRRRVLNMKGGPKFHREAPETTPAAPQERTQRRNSDFTADQFVKAWNGFIAAHPSEHILINAMRVGVPSRGSDATHYVVTVENEIIADAITRNIGVIRREISDTLSNDYVEIEVIIDSSAASSMTWNEKEVLAEMMNNTPVLRSFVKELKLTLG